MEVVSEEKERDEVAVPSTEATTAPPKRPHGNEPRRISGSLGDDEFLVSELEDEENDSVAAPVSEIPQDDDEDDEEDEYEYEYEDEDDAAFSGFLMTAPSYHSSAAAEAPTSPVRIRDEDDAVAVSVADDSGEDNKSAVQKKSKWKQPSREAVDMSLRAERETSGGKRRLAQDLYKIMMADTEEAGFNLEPKSEDSMDKWTIRLFGFDKDSNLHKDMLIMGLDHVELEMSFPEQYPFAPPFVRVVRPRFKRQTGFVMNGALCMELLTNEGWNPVNDIESVIVSIRSLLVVGDARLAAAAEMSDEKREAILGSLQEDGSGTIKRERSDSAAELDSKKPTKLSKAQAGHYSMAEAQAAYSHLTKYHQEKGWDASGWWARKG